MIFQNAQAILTFAQASNIRLEVRNKQLLIDAPKGVLSPEFKQCLAQHKQVLIFMLAHYGLSLEEIKAEAKEDWQDIKDDANAVHALANALYKQRLMELGQLPPSYTAITHCAHCGDVYVPLELVGSGKVLGCPWCFIRIKNLPIYKSKTGG